MKQRARWSVVVLTATCAFTPARADRIVNYAVDEVAAVRDAAEQGVALAPIPARGTRHLAVRIAPAVDHEVLRVGIACSAWKVQNPMSALLQRFLTAFDRDGAPASSLTPAAGMLVTVDRARTLSRCVGTGEMRTTCITRVSIDGTTMLHGETARPFRVEREEAAKGVGVCAGLARGIGLVSRQAAGALVDELRDLGRETSHPVL